MAYPVWITPAGDLGIIPENQYFDIQLDAYNPGGGSLTFTKISGQLPPGIQLTRTGELRGVPDRKSTRLNSSHSQQSRMPSSA